MAFKRAAVFAALLLFSVWGTAHAQDVTVKSPDGQVELSGTLLGFDGEFYRLDTVYGEMTIDGSGVRCEGPAELWPKVGDGPDGRHIMALLGRRNSL